MGRQKIVVLTKQQAIIMQEICRYYDDHAERMPTIRELKARLLLTDSTIFFHIKELILKGYLSKSPLKARNLRILKRVEQKAAVMGAVPILKTTVSDKPWYSEESCVGAIMVDVALTRCGKVFALKVRGDSMINIGLEEGDFAVIRHQPVAQHNDIVAAIVNNEVTLRRLHFTPDRIALIPENYDHDAIDLTHYDTFRIIGIMLKHLKPEEVIHAKLQSKQVCEPRFASYAKVPEPN